MQYFNQFNWAMPTAFAQALGQCRFEYGDILYPNKEAYENSEQSEVSLQVHYPLRKENGEEETKTSGVFGRNWNSEVRLQKYVNGKPKGNLIVTTQGRLYTLTWKGDIESLSAELTECLPPNFDSKNILKLLPEAESKARKLAKISPVFVMPYDPAIRSSTKKFISIDLSLQIDPEKKIVLLTPRNAGIAKWSECVPTISIAFIITPNIDRTTLFDKIKRATYKNSKNPNSRSYNIERHGIIY